MGARPDGSAGAPVWYCEGATGAGSTSEFSGPVLPVGLEISKRAYLADGTPIPDGVTVPRGTRVQFLLYINNSGGAVSDVSIADALAPSFSYVSGSLKFGNTVAACAGAICTLAEEAAILSATEAGTTATDAIDGDIASFGASTVNAGNQTVANAQLDIAAAKVWAIVLTVRMQ